MQKLAVRHPNLVRGLFVTNAIPCDSWPVPGVKIMRALGSLVKHLPDAVFQEVLRLFYRIGHGSSRHWPFYDHYGGAGTRIWQVRALNVNDTLHLADRLPTLDLPARLVWGAADRFQPIGYRLAYNLKAPLDAVEWAKHLVPEDDAERVANAVNDLQTEPNGSHP